MPSQRDNAFTELDKLDTVISSLARCDSERRATDDLEMILLHDSMSLHFLHLSTFIPKIDEAVLAEYRRLAHATAFYYELTKIYLDPNVHCTDLLQREIIDKMHFYQGLCGRFRQRILTEIESLDAKS